MVRVKSNIGCESKSLGTMCKMQLSRTLHSRRAREYRRNFLCEVRFDAKLVFNTELIFLQALV